jgi:hypoxanthine-DNA glycosylase
MSKFSFAPITSKDAQLLILGTLPGEQSLQAQQYYAHAANAFWKIMFVICEQSFSTDYAVRTQLLLQHKMALWDVLMQAEREGSLDSAIRNEQPNDFAAFLKAHKKVHTIFFNGQNACKLFHKHVYLQKEMTFVTLPSTSPAHAAKSFAQKLKVWEQIKGCMLNSLTKS